MIKITVNIIGIKGNRYDSSSLIVILVTPSAFYHTSLTFREPFLQPLRVIHCAQIWIWIWIWVYFLLSFGLWKVKGRQWNIPILNETKGREYSFCFAFSVFLPFLHIMLFLLICMHFYAASSKRTCQRNYTNSLATDLHSSLTANITSCVNSVSNMYSYLLSLFLAVSFVFWNSFLK